MKLWIFLTTLLCLAVRFGYSDIGFGHSDDVDDESVPLQPVIPPPLNSNLKRDLTDTKASDGPVIPSRTEHEHAASSVESMETAVVGTDGVADAAVSEISNTEQKLEDNQEGDAGIEPVLQSPDSVVSATGADAIESDNTTHIQAISSSYESGAEVEPEPALLISEPAREHEPKIDETIAENGIESMWDEFNMGGGSTTEALLDQLDAAEAQIATLTSNNAALTASLATATADASVANKEVAELRAQVAALTTSLEMVSEELRTKANITSEQQEQLNGQHALEIQAVNDKLTACERNATTLAIKARLEKNEKNIARLSVENCQLTLESSRHVQLDEMQELEAQVIALKKQLSEGKCSTTSATSNPSSNTQSVRKLPTSSATTSAHPSTSASGVECDASQCVDRLLSKYVFFWAPEHQSPKLSPASPPSTATTATTVSPLHSAPTITTTSSSDRTASRAQGVSKTGRSDAHLDRIGDDDPAGDSGALLALHVLQRAGSSAASLYTQHLHPLVYTLLKSEFMVVALVAKGAYDGIAWLWSAAISPVFFNTVLPTLQNVYYTQLMPFVHSTVYPWYRLNLEQTVNSTLDKAYKHYIEHYEELIGDYILDPCEFLIGRVYYLQYFLLKFLQSEDLGEQMEQIVMYVANFVPSVITQLCRIPALQSHFGDSCVFVVSSVVYGTVALGSYLCRRVVLGVVALVLIFLLSPLLLGVYLCAKVLAVLRPRKKTKRAAGASRSSSNTTGNGSNGGKGAKGNSTSRRDNSISSNFNNHAALHASSSSQVSTKLPMNAAIASVAPGSHSVSGSGHLGSPLPPPPTISHTVPYGGQMYAPRGSGGNTSLSSAPPQGPYAYSSAASSGAPPRQVQHRSGSDESLNQLGAPPTSVTGETWPGV